MSGQIKEGVFKVNVSNNCRGISTSKAQKFFERFYVKDNQKMTEAPV